MTIVWVIILLVLAVGGLVIWLLLNFANKTKPGVLEFNQEKLENGIHWLKNYFAVYCIMSIIGILFTIFNLLT